MHRWSNYSLTSENIGIYEEIFENVKVIDCHAHIGKDKDGHSMTADKMIKLMDSSKIDKAIVFPLNDPKNSKNFNLPNDHILLASRVYKERFIPFFRLNPHNNWKKEMKLRIEQGFRGIKLHPRSQNFQIASPIVMKIYEECEKNNLAIIMHTGFGLEEISEDILSIVKTFPALKFIIGHSGFVDLDNMIKRLKNARNIMFDTSTVKIFDLFELLKKVDYQKIAFGSDIPYYDIDLALEGLVDSAITVGKSAFQIRKILGGNILKWFN